jgi:drug/metabolite transporter (DMT)-like permease
MASILNATTPIFMVVVAHWGTQDEKLSWGKVAGIALGIAGVMVLVGPDAFGGGSYIWGELAIVGASCAYGFGGVYSRRFKDLPPLVAATGQVSGGAVILLPLSLLIDHPWGLPVPDSGVCGARLFYLLPDAGRRRRHLYLAGDIPDPGDRADAGHDVPERAHNNAGVGRDGGHRIGAGSD